MGYDEKFKKEILDAFFESKDSLRKFANNYGMSRNTLYRWAQDDPRYEVVHKKAVWRKYTPEFKYKAIQMVIVDGLSSHKVAEIMGCKYGSLVSGWVRAYKQKGLVGLEPPKYPIGKNKPDTKKAKKSKAGSLEEYVRELEAENEKLDKENKQLKFQADVAHAIAEVRSKKGSGLDASLLSNAEKTKIVDVLRPKYLLKDLLQYLGLRPSSYEYCRQVRNRPDKYADERAVVIEVFMDASGVYGYRRIAASINNDNHNVNISERIVRRIMKEEKLHARQPRKKSYSSYQGEVGKIASNILKRNFKVSRPLEKVVTDVTEFKVAGKRVYLSPLIDLYAGEVISYSAGLSPTVEFILKMFDEKTKQKIKDSCCVAHTDQGFQYQHIAYRSLLEDLGCIQSMSRKGNCLDNASAESFFARLKTEFYYGRKFSNIDQFYRELDEYIWWYNNKRIKMRLGGLSPVAYRQANVA